MANNVAHYPHFLGIGAARAGTTWLSEHLGAHPDIWIPRVKELHYFTRSERYVGPSQLADGTALQRMFSRQQPFQKYRKTLARAIASNIVRPSMSKLKWDANYLLRRPNDRWYATLFSQGFGKVTGEITPRYSLLDHEDIWKLKQLIPDLQLIFVMRDPVERTWSLLKYHAKRAGRELTRVPTEELRRRAFADIIVRLNDYDSILNRWRAVFPTEQLLELYFDEIQDQPDALLRRVHRFLGIRTEWASGTEKNGKVNGSFSKAMPDFLRQDLIAHYRPMIKRLSEQEGGYFSRWLECYDAQLPAVDSGRQVAVPASRPAPGLERHMPPLNP